MSDTQENENSSPPTPADPPLQNSIMKKALEKGRLRYFRASRGTARGKSGREDTEVFADNLMVLQECALLIGECLEMNAVAHAIVYDGETACAFQFDQNSNPKNPELVGALVNRRIPMREMLAGLREYINSK